MADVVLFNGSEAAKSIQGNFFTEYLDGNTLSPFMGDMSAIINVEEVGKGEGDTHTFTLVGALDPDKRSTGNQQAAGNGERQKSFANALQIQLVRKPAILENVKTIAQRTPMKLFERLRPQLLEVTQEMLRNVLVDSAAYATGGSSPVQARALFGVGESNYNATINTALGNVDATNDKLTVAHIRMLKRKAVAQTNPAGAKVRKIRPFRMESDNGVKDEYFCLFADPRAIADLQTDSTFIALATQGKMEEKAPSFVRGSRFRGMVDNVLIYEEPAVQRIGYATAGASSSPVAHNLFCGAQAFGLVYGYLKSEMADEYRDFGNIYEVCHTELRGQGMLTFGGYENGIIHSFTTAANG